MGTYNENDKQHKNCRCLYCVGECLCDECDYCSECTGYGCTLATSITTSKEDARSATIESLDGIKTDVVFKYNTSFTNDDIKDLFESIDWIWDIDVDKLRLALTRSTTIITVYIGNKLVGLIRCMHDGCYSGIIDCLVVHKDYWNRGIGSSLIKNMIEATRDVKHISLSSSEIKNIALYAKCGFYEVSDGKLLQIEN